MLARRVVAAFIVVLGFACSATATPSPDALCNTYCDKVTAASCDLAPAHSTCVSSCQTRSSTCGVAYTGLLTCVLRKGSVVCGSGASVGSPGCPIEESNDALCDECQLACIELHVDSCGVDAATCAAACAKPDGCSLQRRALANCITSFPAGLAVECTGGTPQPKGACESEAQVVASCDPAPFGRPSLDAGP